MANQPNLTTNDPDAHQLAVLQWQATARTARNMDILMLAFVWIPLGLLILALTAGIGVLLATLIIHA